MSALDRARQLQPGSTVRWDRLEREAFEAHPDVLIGPQSDANRRPHAGEWLLLAPLLVLVAVAFGSPIWGYVAIAADSSRFATAAPDSDPRATIPVAGVFYGCALVLLVGLFVTWLVRGRPKARIDFGFSLLTVILGSMTALGIWGRGTRDEVDNWDVWILPVIAAVVFGGLYAFVLLVIRLRHQAATTMSFADSDELDARQARAADLDERRREAIRADLAAAIDDLEERGLVTESVAERARRVELGGLGLTMRAKSTF